MYRGKPVSQKLSRNKEMPQIGARIVLAGEAFAILIYGLLIGFEFFVRDPEYFIEFTRTLGNFYFFIINLEFI